MQPSDLWNRSEGALIDDGMSLKKFIETYGIAGTVLAVAYAIQQGILNLGETITGVVGAFTGGIVTVINATFGQGAAVIGAGSTTTQQSFLTGTASLLGPFAFPAAVGVTLGALYLLVWTWNRSSWNPLGFLGRFGG